VAGVTVVVCMAVGKLVPSVLIDRFVVMVCHVVHFQLRQNAEACYSPMILLGKLGSISHNGIDKNNKMTALHNPERLTQPDSFPMQASILWA
jgi:hypothetical protein